MALDKKKKVEQDLAALERQIYELESHYLTQNVGANIVDGFVSYSKLNPSKKTVLPVPESSRVFSLSSVTSPIGNRPWPDTLRTQKSLQAAAK